MSEIVTTLHPQGDTSVDIYPNIKLENIIDTTPADVNKVLKINSEGKVYPDTIDTASYVSGTGISFNPTEDNNKEICLDNDTQLKLSQLDINNTVDAKITALDDLITDAVGKIADNEIAIKNKYTKPESGIPKTDLNSSVQSSLTKADSSINNIKLNGQLVTVTDNVADLGTVITEHQNLDGKQDKLNAEQLAAVNSGITSNKVSTYDGYKSQIDAKYIKPEDGIPESDLSTSVQSALTKANNALTAQDDLITDLVHKTTDNETKLLSTVTTNTEQTITSKKSFNSGLTSSSTGSNGIQTSIDMSAGADLKLEQQKSGAKLGIQFNTTNKQLSIYNVSGETEHRLDFDEDGVKYGESEIATKADLNAKVANSNFVGSVDYDNTTLKAHIDEILGYVNSENGGTLVSIGFKVGTEGASTTITNLHMSSDNTISIDTETDVILGAGSYYYAYPEQVVTSGVNEGVFFTCRNGFTLGHGILYITDAGTKEAKLTGESTVITSTTQITKMMFQDIDVSEVALEHLTLNFYKFNQA